MNERVDVLEIEKQPISTLVAVAACAARFFKANIGGHNFYDSVKGNNWDLSTDVCLKFVDLIGKKFSRTGRIYGYVDPGIMSASHIFSKYSESKDFDVFVEGVMSRVCKEASEAGRSSLSDGYVVFSHYKDLQGRDQILVVMLGKKGGFDFDNNQSLTPKDTESLNLQDFRQAACMDLTGFKTEFPENKGESYLYFIKGKSKSEFFNVALGCSDSVPGKVCVDNLKAALSAYFDEAGTDLSVAQKRKINARVTSFVESRAGVRVQLTDIQEEINKCLPAGSQHNGAFHKFINENSERFKVSEEFQPSHVAAKSMAYVDLKLPSGDFDGKFKLEAVMVAGKGADLSVDRDFAYLTIKLPPEVSARLRSLGSD